MKISFSLQSFFFWMLALLWFSMTFSNALIEISFAAALGAWLILRWKDGTLWRPALPASVLLPLAGFVLISVASYFWSEAKDASFRGIFKILQQVATFYIAADAFRRPEDLGRFRNIFVAVLAFTVLNGLVQYFFGRDLLRGFEGEFSHAGMRITASFGAYGLLAAFLMMNLPGMAGLTWQTWLRKGNRGKLLFQAAVLAGGLWVLFATRSRGAYLAFLAGCFLFLILKKQYRLLVWFFVAVLTVITLMPRSMIIHFDSDFREQSLVERYYLWGRAVHVIEARPWTGTGINTYARVHAKYDKTQNWRVRDYYAHNGYLQMAAETGLPCLFLFLFFLASYFRAQTRGARALTDARERFFATGLRYGALNFLFYAMVDTVLHNSHAVLMFWFLLGLGWAFVKRSEA